MLRAVALRTAVAPRRAAARALSSSHGAPAAVHPTLCLSQTSAQWLVRASDAPPQRPVDGMGMLARTMRRGLSTSASGDSDGGRAKGADWRTGGDADGTQEEVPGATWEGLTEEEAAAAIAGPTPPTRRPLIRFGVVSSDRMHKTVMVKVPYEYVVPVYGKRMTRYSKIMAHDETDSLRIGDRVGIAHVHKRYSKRKAHKVVMVRRVLPRLDDENALPPLEKLKGMQASAN